MQDGLNTLDNLLSIRWRSIWDYDDDARQIEAH